MTKDVENTSESLLSRWAKRRANVRAEDVKSVDAAKVNTSTGEPVEAKSAQTAMPERGLAPDASGELETKPPLPSIESLTQESDFSPFMGKDVAADLRNQAMKKLFTNPHYNVQDGLDIYIGDYTKSDPIPLDMLRKMTQSKALFLFEDEEKAEAEAAAALAAAQSAKTPEIAVASDTISASEPIAIVDDAANSPRPTPAEVIDISIKSH